ncbi:MAG: tetratricopeptide repeat protein [Candidatus Pacebacteria bacterium]|nr:tetratricopeptide repeat protein [Candidatus Paceibacterota bacterium]
MSKTFSFLTKISIYGLVFLMPLFFLPFTVEPFEFNKIYLLFFLTAVGVLAWLAGMIFNQKQLKFNRTRLDIFVLIYLLVMVLSAALSLDKNASIFGFYGRAWPSLLGILSLGGFYFLIVNNVGFAEGDRAKVSVVSLVKVLSVSTLLGLLISYASLLGIWDKIGKVIPFIPQLMKIRAFSTVGGFFIEGYLIDSLEAFCLFLGFTLPLLVVWTAFSHQQNRKTGLWNYFFIIPLLVLGFIMMALVNFWPAWLSLTLALVAFLALALRSRLFRDKINRLALVMIMLGLSLFFLVPALFGFSNPLIKVLAQNKIIGGLQNKIIISALPQNVDWGLAINGVKANPILGAGVGNLPYVFSKYKPESFQKGPFWQFRFDRLSSDWAERLATTGLVGSLVYLLLVVMVVIFSLGFLKMSIKRAQDGVDREISFQEVGFAIVMFVGLISLLISQIFYYQNTTLAFYFWLMLGLSSAGWSLAQQKEKKFDFQDFPELGLIFTVVFIVLTIGLVLICLPLVQNYWADVNYRNYLVSSGQDIAKLESAAKMAGDQATYHTVLSLAYFKKFSEEIAKPQPDPQVVRNMLLLTRQEANKAMTSGSNRVVAQELAGVVYRDMRAPALTLATVAIDNLEKSLQNNPDDQKVLSDLDQIKKLAQEFEQMPLVAFERAVSLDPQNPVLLTELGKLKKDQNDLAAAKSLFEKAIAQRADYIFPYLQLSLIYEAEGNSKEATALLEGVVQQAPTWVEARFHLGRLYYNDKNYDSAIQQFQQALRYYPDHSNSMYSLAKIYEKRGENQKALQLLERVLELNPNNQDVIKEIDSLNGSIQASSSTAEGDKLKK